jgi:phosphoglycolate phosphatase
MTKPDSLLFDLDGTLWDAADTYAHCWNKSFDTLQLERQMSREELIRIMGMEKKTALQKMFPDWEESIREEAYRIKNNNLIEVTPQMGGVLYKGVKEGLPHLAKKYKLFLVSNCSEELLPLFVQWAQLQEYITDVMAHGSNGMPKSHNISLLVEKYRLQHPVYVGDTPGDSEQSKIAGVPFVYVSYGFGVTDQYELKFDSFEELTSYFLQL